MKYKNNSIQVSCDGGAATGKSTGAKMISKNLILSFYPLGCFIDMQVIYCLDTNQKGNHVFKKKFQKLDYRKLDKLYLHSPEITEFSAIIAKKNYIRSILKISNKFF